MNAKTAVVRSATGLLSLAMLAASGGLSFAAANDYATRDNVPAGVTVSGVNVGGLTSGAVRATVERSVVDTLMQPAIVRIDGIGFEIDPADYLFVDVEGAIDDAYEPSRSATIAARVLRLAAGTPVTHAVEPGIEIDQEALAHTIAGFASEIDFDPVDARISIEDGKVAIQPSADGLRVDTDAALELLSGTLLDGAHTADVPTEVVPPAIADRDLGKTIVVRLASRTLELYENLEIDRTYRVAIGKSGHATPRGTWEITAKRYRPTWRNPGSAWAAEMPEMIPPGPNNPLGTRALNLNASGIRIHGNSAIGSIGTAASHGCLRMVTRDIEELYDLVDVGTPVLVVAE